MLVVPRTSLDSVLEFQAVSHRPHRITCARRLGTNGSLMKLILPKYEETVAEKKENS